MNKVIPAFFIALGVVIGGAFFGSFAAVFIDESPLKILSDLAADLKLYAIVAAIGGTFNNLRLIEGSIFQGELNVIIQQILILVTAFLGALLGNWLIVTLAGGK